MSRIHENSSQNLQKIQQLRSQASVEGNIILFHALSLAIDCLINGNQNMLDVDFANLKNALLIDMFDSDEEYKIISRATAEKYAEYKKSKE